MEVNYEEFTYLLLHYNYILFFLKKLFTLQKCIIFECYICFKNILVFALTLEQRKLIVSFNDKLFKKCNYIRILRKHLISMQVSENYQCIQDLDSESTGKYFFLPKKYKQLCMGQIFLDFIKMSFLKYSNEIFVLVSLRQRHQLHHQGKKPMASRSKGLCMHC